jgi:hypothetical protein
MELLELEPSVSNKTHKITFRTVMMEEVIPMFTGVLGSLVICAYLLVYTTLLPMDHNSSDINEIIIEMEGSSFLAVIEDVPDLVLEYYRNPEYHEWVTGFFAAICSSREIAQAILQNSDEFDVSASLAFALSWEESRFNPRAINRLNKDGSIDRGLFQLNNRSFPHLENAAFYDVRSNARYGVSHLKHCLEIGGSEVSALAMYNAGAGRVKSTGAPEVTLNYISRILANKSKIESRFHSMLIKEEEHRLEELKEMRNNQPQFSRTLHSVSPL